MAQRPIEPAVEMQEGKQRDEIGVASWLDYSRQFLRHINRLLWAYLKVTALNEIRRRGDGTKFIAAQPGAKQIPCLRKMRQ